MVEFCGKGEGPCPTHTLLKQLPRTFSYILLKYVIEWFLLNVL
jgi:hypothetical protein